MLIFREAVEVCSKVLDGRIKDYSAFLQK